jgi:pyrroline-5-carboxylate reductase
VTADALAGRLAVIGGGRMGEAIVAGLVGSGSLVPSQIAVADPNEARRSQLASEHGVAVFSDGIAAVSGADTVILAVKPQVIDAVAQALAPALKDAVVVSIAGGVTCARLESMLPPGTAVIRVMPNTPALVGSGMSIVSGGAEATPEQVARVAALFGCVGTVVILDEHLQDACTAISGCGPAYMALVIDALARAGVREGLSRDTAQMLALATMRGTVDLIEKTGQHPGAVIDAVSSPGGSTIAAVNELEVHGVRAAFAAAVRAAVDRSREMGRQS